MMRMADLNGLVSENLTYHTFSDMRAGFILSWSVFFFFVSINPGHDP